MIESGFGRIFHDLNYSEVGFLIFLELIICLRASSKNFVENHKFNVILSYFKQNLKMTCSISLTCTPLALSSKICRLLLEFVGHHKLFGFVDQYVFEMFMIFFK